MLLDVVMLDDDGAAEDEDPAALDERTTTIVDEEIDSTLLALLSIDDEATAMSDEDSTAALLLLTGADVQSQMKEVAVVLLVALEVAWDPADEAPWLLACITLEPVVDAPDEDEELPVPDPLPLPSEHAVTTIRPSTANTRFMTRSIPNARACSTR